ncbi:aldo/keto reductase [Pseudomyxococcus flavus]
MALSFGAPGAKGGESEQLIGEWMAARGNRSKVLVATKVAKWKAQPGLSAANIRAAIEGSLKRLQTDYVDLYYAHEDDPKVEQPEYLAAFDALVKEGKVRALGRRTSRPSGSPRRSRSPEAMGSAPSRSPRTTGTSSSVGPRAPWCPCWRRRA